MFPKRSKTFHSAILLAYVGLSFLGGPIHHWTHHAICSDGACSSAVCHATPSVQTGNPSNACDDLSTPPNRHCCCNHDIPKSGSCPNQKGELPTSSQNDPGQLIKAHSQDCEICSQLARLNQSWATSDPVTPTVAEVADPLIEQACLGPSRTSIDPRSRAPPTSQCS